MGVKKNKSEVLQSLLIKLNKVADGAPRGSHTKVAEMMQISDAGLMQIRRGNRRTFVSQRNITYLESIINCYNECINNEIKRLSKI